MSNVRAIKSVTAFDFRADFGAQPEPAKEVASEADTRVSFSGEELAALITQVRAETLAEVEQSRADSESERLAAVSAELSQALEEITQVMGLIGAAQYHAVTETRLRSLIDGAAARIVSGQGDLFPPAASSREGQT